MLKTVTFALAFLLLLLQFSLPTGAAYAAKKMVKEQPAARAQNMPAAKAGEEVKTEFFQIKIPSGWIMPYPVNQKHNPEGTSAVFSDEKTKVTITINVIQTPLSLKNFTNTIVNEMKKSGLKPGMPVMENGLNKIIIRGTPQGEAWFGSNGRLCTATVILSQQSDVSVANQLLNQLRSSSPNLFPKKIK